MTVTLMMMYFNQWFFNMDIKSCIINSSTVALFYMGEILFVDVKIANGINKINKEEQNLS